ncbi:MAG TPA: DegV family protein [Candidatus Limnocylindrales bacterium]|nr:DegV family protein [Candidatus Limnocylindrales bacterium]
MPDTSRVAIVTDSASDLPPEQATQAGIRVVPLEVTFGTDRFRAGVDLSTEAFWTRMLAPDAPFPTTAAASPGDFEAAFEGAFAAGVESVVCITVGGKLSATLQSARIARDLHPERDVHVIDSNAASMAQGLLALHAAEVAAAGASGAQVAAAVDARLPDVDLFVALDTLEYLRKGGRISTAQAAIGALLSIKPIITLEDGIVDTVDRVRTRSKARERVVEVLSARPLDALAILYTPPADGEAFRDEVVARLVGGIDPAHVSVQPVGASVGPHLGPGCLGGCVLFARQAGMG